MHSRVIESPQFGLILAKGDKSDTLALIHTFQPRLKPVERELQSGIDNLVRIHREIIHNRAKFQPLVEKSAKELSQAEANVKSMKILGIF
jgi:hypothetical protein